ncbi:hypothetical protein EYR36_002215 [Pleurotus pulmonarius]|nr:hypothetical protein EYR36_002215 [Pleurotus pulmonarius]
MQLRQLTFTSVILACAIAVFAAPAPLGMFERDVEQDVEVRNWDPSDAHHVLNAYRAAVLEARTPQRSGGRPAVRPAAPRPPAAPAPRPNAPAPRPNTPPPQRPNTAPAQRPNTPPAPRPNTPAPKPNTPAPKPNTPAPKPSTTAGAQSTQKPAAAQCGARSNGKNKRAFSTTCDTNSLTLGRVTRPITKVAAQGNSAITYRVDGGWPDPSTGSLVTAYAKTGPSKSRLDLREPTAHDARHIGPGSTFTDEAKWLRKTDQLLAEGSYDGNNFIVFRGVTGKTDLTGTTFFATQLAPVMMGQANRARCEALVKQKLVLVVRQVRAFVDNYGILHTDVQPGNILWDSAANSPTLIDWGRARDVGVGQWSAELEASVTAQAEFSHLRGGEKLCGL